MLSEDVRSLASDSLNGLLEWQVSETEESLEHREYLRRRVLRALRVYFAQKRWPRLAMSIIVIATGGVGALVSWWMLRSGLDQMWMRYPLALLVAWGAFLGLVRLWAEVESRYFHADEDIAALLQGHDPKDAMTRLKERDWSVLDWLDLGSFPIGDDEGGCALSILVFLLGLLVLLFGWALVTVVVTAPILIAEVFLDAVLVSALYRRMNSLDQRWWLTSAVQQTFVPVMVTAVVLAICGAAMEAAAPGAKSIGGVVKHLQRVN